MTVDDNKINVVSKIIFFLLRNFLLSWKKIIKRDKQIIEKNFNSLIIRYKRLNKLKVSDREFPIDNGNKRYWIKKSLNPIFRKFKKRKNIKRTVIVDKKPKNKTLYLLEINEKNM